jgi:hypothetical protein
MMASNRIYLKQILRLSHAIFLGIFVLGFAGSIEMTVNDAMKFTEFLLTVLLLLTPLSYLIFTARGYRLSYDDEAVYMRPQGFNWKLRYYPEISMRYDEIKQMGGEWGDMGFRAAGGGLAMPFRFIKLYRKSAKDEEEFVLDPIDTIHEEMQDLVRFILEKRPDLATNGVTDYLNSQRRI